MAAKTLWVEKYRPKTLDDYVFHDDQQKSKIERLIKEQDLPHLLLSGTQGSGKTTLAKILINQLEVDDCDLLEVNASQQTGVDFLRDTVIPFAEGYAMGKFRVVHLEEFDYLSQNAQGMLRNVMEATSETCRFIATCNYENKVIAPIKSRFQQMRFKAPNEDETLVKMFLMLEAEGVTFSDDVLLKYVKQAYPDLRKLINNLQAATVDGKLLDPGAASVEQDYKFKLLELLPACDFRGIRKLIVDNVPQEELEEVYRFLHQNLALVPTCKDVSQYEKAILILADGIRAHGLSALPHLTLEATCIKLMMSLNG